MELEILLKKFEENINKIKEKYLEQDNYFFTEKEIHAYFYHLCLQDNIFTTNDGLNLIHSEYPTPFKCSFDEEFKIQRIESEYIRGHLDLVLLNPNFIEWIKSRETNYLDYVRGLKNAKFSEYIKDFIKSYREFVNEKKQRILLYSLEFKYFRGTIEGIKNPVHLIKQDIEKLRNTRTINLELLGLSELGKELTFIDKIKSIVFLGSNNIKIKEEIDQDDYFINVKNILDIVHY